MRTTAKKSSESNPMSLIKAGLATISMAWIAGAIALTACQNDSSKLVGFNRGSTLKTKGEPGTQRYSSNVDILFVVDDSGSMGPHQTNLANNLDLFVEGLKKNKIIDWHVGVISTAEREAFGGSNAGPGAGRLNGRYRVVDKMTPNGFAEIKRNILMGTGGSGYERMFSPTRLALTEPNLSGWNAGFYRKDAFLAVIFITDADDQSNVNDMNYPRSTTDPNNMSPQSFYKFLKDLKGGNASNILTYGAWVPLNVPPSQCPWDDNNMPHVRLDEFFTLSKAQTYSLCDPNYGRKLSEIGTDLAAKVAQRIYLERRPIRETIRIHYGTQEIPSDSKFGFTYDEESNSISFGTGIQWSQQAAGVNVEVSFDTFEHD